MENDPRSHTKRPLFVQFGVVSWIVLGSLALPVSPCIKPAVPAIDNSPQLAAIVIDSSVLVLFVGAEARRQPMSPDDPQFAGAWRQTQVFQIAQKHHRLNQIR